MSEKLFATSSHDDSLHKSASDEAATVPEAEIKGNILTQYTEDQVQQMGRNYAAKENLDPELFAKAAAVARTPSLFALMSFLSIEEKEALQYEATHKWDVPGRLIAVIAMGSMAAAVQGMDETVINGANLFYPKAFGINTRSDADYIEGLINGAPYLCCGVIACWMSDFCNRKLGRKWVIFWTCVISALTCIWLALVNNWWHLFIARFFLGFGIGIKSATVPAYAAECAPPRIRGSLVMLWQFFTAVGIMFGYVASLAFYSISPHGIHYGLNWRLMLGLACIPAIIVCAQVPFVPESPRWLMGKNRHREAFESLASLRRHELMAARDCFYQYVLLQEEELYTGLSTFQRACQMFTVRRNRNGALGAWIVMFMQQFCGINVIAYYSSSIFVQSGFTEIQALLASWGFGMINFTFAIPAFFTIDKFGRRFLLLTTFPLMAIFLLIAGCGLLIDESNMQGRLAMVIVGIYLFSCVYSAGEGPVPFTYSAEAFPLYIRDLGMSFATATCWFFNFILAFTWPRLRTAFTPTGAFGWYAAWNVVGFFLVLMFLPETKDLTLEELDQVFDVPIMEHARYHLVEFWHNTQRVVFRKDVPHQKVMYSQRMAVTNEEWNNKPEMEHVE